MAGTQKELSDIDLKLDVQVQKFLETKQKLTYFLITASVVVIGLTFEFVSSRLTTIEHLIWVVIASAVAGLLTAGTAIANLHLEMRSFSLHLTTRHERKGWDDLSTREKRTWDNVNAWAGRFLSASLLCLAIEILLAVTFFAIFVSP